MHAAGFRAHRDPGGLAARLRYDRIVGNRMAGAFDALGGADHPLTVDIAALRRRFRIIGTIARGLVRIRNALDHPAADLAHRRVWHTDRDGPVDLVHIPALEHVSELVGRARMLGEQQDTGGFLVEPVDEHWPVFLVRIDTLKQSVDMAPLPRAALHGDAGGLV